MYRRGISGLGIGLSDLAYVPTTPNAPSTFGGRIVRGSPSVAPPPVRLGTTELAVPVSMTRGGQLTRTLRLQPLVPGTKR